MNLLVRACAACLISAFITACPEEKPKVEVSPIPAASPVHVDIEAPAPAATLTPPPANK